MFVAFESLKEIRFLIQVNHFICNKFTIIPFQICLLANTQTSDVDKPIFLTNPERLNLKGLLDCAFTYFPCQFLLIYLFDEFMVLSNLTDQKAIPSDFVVD